jgi:ketosteroid isomerase-like protein
MRVFAEDAVLLPHQGDAFVEGYEAIRYHFWPPGSAPLTVDDYTMAPAEIGGCGDLAYSRGKFTLEFTISADNGTKSYSVAGTYMMILREQNARWLISRFMWDDAGAQERPTTGPK